MISHCHVWLLEGMLFNCEWDEPWWVQKFRMRPALGLAARGISEVACKTPHHSSTWVETVSVQKEIHMFSSKMRLPWYHDLPCTWVLSPEVTSVFGLSIFHQSLFGQPVIGAFGARSLMLRKIPGERQASPRLGAGEVVGLWVSFPHRVGGLKPHPSAHRCCPCFI